MHDIKTVIIGIQARSTSHRFPRKVHELIGDKTVLQHVLSSCDSAINHINRWSHKNGIMADKALLVPYGDEIVQKYSGVCKIIEGDENDVLSRYKKLIDDTYAHYVVRITADCPFIKAPTISKPIIVAVKTALDYYGNVDPETTTCINGFDFEVMSSNLVKWLDENAKTEYDREHVTPLAYNSPPHWAKTGHQMESINLSFVKLSVDTPEDLQRMRDNYEHTRKAYRRAVQKHGASNIHKF